MVFLEVPHDIPIYIFGHSIAMQPHLGAKEAGKCRFLNKHLTFAGEKVCKKRTGTAVEYLYP